MPIEREVMKLAIKNKWLSFGGASVVQDLEGKDVLKVKGKVFSLRHQKFVTTMENAPLYTVRNKLLSFLGRTAFILDPSGQIVATVRKKLISLKDRYFVESSLGKMEITGNILGYDYHVILDGTEIGHIARKISLRDSFVLDIDDSFDYRLFVALVIAIDNVTDRSRK